jgi:hypothetical protein
VIALAMLLAACGARSGLDVDGGEAPRGDAAAPDAGGRDAGPPPPCELELDGRHVVFEDTAGPFDQPQVAVRADGTIEFVATRITELDDRTTEVRARSATVAGRTLRFAGEVAVLFGPTIWNRAGALGDELGTCSTLGGPTDLTELRAWDGRHAEIRRAMPLAALACHDVVGRGDRWLLLLRGIAEGTVVVERRADGRMVRDPAPAFDPAVGANADAAQIDDGFAWVGGLDADGRTQVVFRDDDGRDSREELRVVPRFGGATTAIGAAFGPGSAAIAYYQGNDLHVALVSAGVGVVATSEPLAFSMGADVDPALARVSGRVLVASLDYGDFDPTGGALHVTVLDEAARWVVALELGSHRDGSLRYGGVGAASIGDDAVLHWAERDADGPSRTLAALVRCR